MRGAAAANFSRAERLLGCFSFLWGEGSWRMGRVFVGGSWPLFFFPFSALFFRAVGSFPDFFNVPRVGEGASIG